MINAKGNPIREPLHSLHSRPRCAYVVCYCGIQIALENTYPKYLGRKKWSDCQVVNDDSTLGHALRFVSDQLLVKFNDAYACEVLIDLSDDLPRKLY